MLDPGIGFGKTVAHNLALIDRLDEILTLGPPVVIGTSRKSFIARSSATPAGHLDPEDRLAGRSPRTSSRWSGAPASSACTMSASRDALAVAAATFGAA